MSSWKIVYSGYSPLQYDHIKGILADHGIPMKALGDKYTNVPGFDIDTGGDYMPDAVGRYLQYQISVKKNDLNQARSLIS